MTNVKKMHVYCISLHLEKFVDIWLACNASGFTREKCREVFTPYQSVREYCDICNGSNGSTGCCCIFSGD